MIDYIKERGSDAQTIQQAVTCQKLKAIIEAGLNKANDKAISKAQRIIKFTILSV